MDTQAHAWPFAINPSHWDTESHEACLSVSLSPLPPPVTICKESQTPSQFSRTSRGLTEEETFTPSTWVLHPVNLVTPVPGPLPVHRRLNSKLKTLHKAGRIDSPSSRLVPVSLLQAVTYTQILWSSLPNIPSGLRQSLLKEAPLLSQILHKVLQFPQLL